MCFKTLKLNYFVNKHTQVDLNPCLSKSVGEKRGAEKLKRPNRVSILPR